MNRRIIIPVATLLLGVLLGILGSYFAVMRGQSRIIETMYAGGLADRVVLAARLRAGQQDKALAEAETIIPTGVLGVHEFADKDDFGRSSLRLAKAYYSYSNLDIPATAQPILAEIEPTSRQSFEKLRDFPIMGSR